MSAAIRRQKNTECAATRSCICRHRFLDVRSAGSRRFSQDLHPLKIWMNDMSNPGIPRRGFFVRATAMAAQNPKSRLPYFYAWLATAAFVAALIYLFHLF